MFFSHFQQTVWFTFRFHFYLSNSKKVFELSEVMRKYRNIFEVIRVFLKFKVHVWYYVLQNFVFFCLVFIFCYLSFYVSFLRNSCRRKKKDIFTLKFKFLVSTIGYSAFQVKPRQIFFGKNQDIYDSSLRHHIFKFVVKIRTFYKQSRVTLKKIKNFHDHFFSNLNSVVSPNILFTW